MKRDIKYIFKRVIIGLILGIIFMNINKCDVFADTNVTFPSYYGWIGSTRFYSDGYYNNYTYADINMSGTGIVIRQDVANSGSGGLAVFSGSIITTSVLGSGTVTNGLLNISQLNFGGNECFYEVTEPVSIGNNQRLYAFTSYCPIKNKTFDIPAGSNIFEMTFGVSTGISRIGFSTVTVADGTDPNILTIVNLLQQLRQNNIYQLDVQQLIRQYLNSYDSVLMQSIINGNNNIQSAINSTNQSIQETNDTLKDDSTDDPDTKITEISGKVATNNVISDLVLLPVTLFSKVLNSLNGSCSTYSLGELYGHEITFPCINVGSYIGGVLWGVIDVVISGLLIYAISRKFVKVFNELSSLKEGDIID